MIWSVPILIPFIVFADGVLKTELNEYPKMITAEWVFVLILCESEIILAS